MGVFEAIEQLVEVEKNLKLPQSVLTSLKFKPPKELVAFDAAPDRSAPLKDFPCFINELDSTEDMGGFGTESNEGHFTIQIDFYAAKVESRAATKLAEAYFDALVQALRAQRPVGQRLRNTVDYLDIRAERPAVETLEWARTRDGKPYMHSGFHLFVTLHIFERVEVA